MAIFVTTLANPDPPADKKEEEKKEDDDKNSDRFVIKNKPLFSPEEFYCFIRPKILIYAKNQSDDLTDVKCANDILKKLRPALSLKITREYFKELSTLDMSTQKEREEYQ